MHLTLNYIGLYVYAYVHAYRNIEICVWMCMYILNIYVHTSAYICMLYVMNKHAIILML